MQIALILVPHHAVHRIDCFVTQRQRCPTDEHIHKRCHHTVRKIFCHRLYGCLCHAFLGKVLRIPAYNPCHRLAGPGQVFRGETAVHTPAFHSQSLHCQCLPAPDGLYRQSQQRVQTVCHHADCRRKEQCSNRQYHREHPAGRPFSFRCGRKTCAQEFFQSCDALSHDYHGMGHPGGVRQPQIQKESHHDGCTDLHALAPLVY